MNKEKDHINIEGEIEQEENDFQEKDIKNLNDGKKTTKNGVKLNILESDEIEYDNKDYILLSEVYQKVTEYLYPYKLSQDSRKDISYNYLLKSDLYLKDSNGLDIKTDKEFCQKIQANHDAFLVHLYKYIINNTDDSNRTKMFFQNIIDINTIRLLKEEKTDYSKLLNAIINNLRNEKNESESKFINFMKYIEEKYIEFVQINKDVNLLLDNKSMGEIIVENSETSKKNYNSKVLIPTIFLIISIVILVITILVGVSGTEDFNWYFFITSIIGIIVSGSTRSNGKTQQEMTCEKCKQWNSLQIIKDEIIATETAVRTESYYTGPSNNQTRHERPYSVRIENHCYTCKCSNCGNIEYKYVEKEYRI